MSESSASVDASAPHSTAGGRAEAGALHASLAQKLQDLEVRRREAQRKTILARFCELA